MSSALSESRTNDGRGADRVKPPQRDVPELQQLQMSSSVDEWRDHPGQLAELVSSSCDPIKSPQPLTSTAQSTWERQGSARELDWLAGVHNRS